MTSQLRAAAAAVTFLTRLPVAGHLALDGDDVRRSGPYFPLVGAAIGAGTGALATTLGRRLTPPLGGALALTGATLLTGALHLDALADTADATGARSPDRALEIMRDSRVGAFGVTAIAADALVKVAALAALAALADRRRSLRAGVAAGALSRAAPVLLAAALPYARPGGGTGYALAGGGGRYAATAGVVAAAVAVASAGTDGARFGAAALASTAMLGAAYRHWLGGVTGDALGAAAELTETLVLVLAVARLQAPR
jgi:cobalamin 5'-phosphate synthase/cobalamin synthase